MDTEVLFDMRDDREPLHRIAEEIDQPIYRVMVAIQKRMYGWHVEMAGELGMEPHDMTTFLSHVGAIMAEHGDHIDWDDVRYAYQITQGKYMAERYRAKREAMAAGATPLPDSSWHGRLLELKERHGLNDEQ